MLPVQVLDSKNSLSEVEARHVGGEGAHVLEQRRTVAPLHILHHQAQVVLGLETTDHRHHERVVREAHDVTLVENLLHLQNNNIKCTKWIKKWQHAIDYRVIDYS